MSSALFLYQGDGAVERAEAKKLNNEGKLARGERGTLLGTITTSGLGTPWYRGHLLNFLASEATAVSKQSLRSICVQKLI